MFKDDRKFIENKYHKTDKNNEEFNPYNRMGYHGYEFDKTTGLEDDEISKGLLCLYDTIKDLPSPIIKAKAVEYVLDNTKIDINEHDLFVGFWSVNRLAKGITLDKKYNEMFNEIIPATAEKMRNLNEAYAVNIWPDFDHVVPDWSSVLSLGFSGLLKRAEEYKENHKKTGSLTKEKEAFFDGIIIQYKAIINIIDRMYKVAVDKKFEKADKIAKCLLSIRDNPPMDIYQAMQTMYIYFMVSECFDCYQVRSLGNGLDNSLYGFYNNDIKNGTYTKDEIKEMLKYFMFQWQAIGNYWGQPFYMGGTDENGNTKYNELSYLILEAYDELNIYNPKIQIKVNENTPDKIIFKVFDMIRKGHNSFVFCCEPGMIKAVMNYGATYEEALNMDIRGCYETGVRANEVSTGTGYINSVKSVLYVFSNGYDNKIQKQLGIKTGEIETLSTFEDFYNAVLKQWDNLIEMTINTANEYEKYLGYINPSNMYSATIEGALKKGVDAYQCGVKFNNSAILNCGFASLVDSVMAVKKFVYDTKTVTLAEMKAALESDWKGYENLRTAILKDTHKYGNNDYETDMYTEAMSVYYAAKVNNRPNARGGVYKAIMHSAMQFVWQGQNTGATPDGRHSGDELAKNASPSVGMDKNGVTALINSVLKTCPDLYSESHCLDVMLHPTAVEGEEGLEIMKSLLFMYMRSNGQSVQFNVFNTDMLKEAQKNPDKYKNLQVRVCGWNVLWNNLSKKEQDAYIKRGESFI